MGRQKTGRIGKPKLFYLPTLICDLLKRYSELTGKTQSAIVAEMIAMANQEFRKENKLDEIKGVSDVKGEKKGTMDDKGKRLAEAFMRSKLFDFKKGKSPFGDDWEETGQ